MSSSGVIAGKRWSNRVSAIPAWVASLTLTLGCQQPKRSQLLPPTTSPGLRDPDAARQANERGLEAVEQGELDAAETAFRESFAADRSFAPAQNNLGLVLRRRGRVYEAANAFSRASELDPAAAEPLLNLGGLYERIGCEKAAVEEYERVFTRDRDNAEARARIARLNPRTGEALDWETALASDRYFTGSRRCGYER